MLMILLYILMLQKIIHLGYQSLFTLNSLGSIQYPRLMLWGLSTEKPQKADDFTIFSNQNYTV